MVKPEFTSKIDLGHLIQSAILIAMLGGGVIVPFYFSFNDRLNKQSEIVSGITEKLAQNSRDIQRMQDDERRLADAITSSLAKVSDQIADVRVLIAGRNNSRGH